MAYFIFLKNSDNIEGTLVRIAENEIDLDNLNLNTDKGVYKIIEVSNDIFNKVKLDIQTVVGYNGDTVKYTTSQYLYVDSTEIKKHIDNYKSCIKNFIKNNPNHIKLNQWNNYYLQLENFDVESINYPLTSSLEKYFNDSNQTSLSLLQLP